MKFKLEIVKSCVSYSQVNSNDLLFFFIFFQKEPPGAAKPTKYHYYPHNQHIYLLPECAIQQVSITLCKTFLICSANDELIANGANRLVMILSLLAIK